MGGNGTTNIGPKMMCPALQMFGSPSRSQTATLGAGIFFTAPAVETKGLVNTLCPTMEPYGKINGPPRAKPPASRPPGPPFLEARLITNERYNMKLKTYLCAGAAFCSFSLAGSIAAAVDFAFCKGGFEATDLNCFQQS